MRDRWETGFAVRREWPGGGHEFVGFNTSADRLPAFIRRDRSYWRRGPVRPTRWAVVEISHGDFDLHARRHDCRAPDCPDAPAERDAHSFTPR